MHTQFVANDKHKRWHISSLFSPPLSSGRHSLDKRTARVCSSSLLTSDGACGLPVTMFVQLTAMSACVRYNGKYLGAWKKSKADILPLLQSNQHTASYARSSTQDLFWCKDIKTIYLFTGGGVGVGEREDFLCRNWRGRFLLLMGVPSPLQICWGVNRCPWWNLNPLTSEMSHKHP